MYSAKGEERLEMSFILNFCRFVEWPAKKLSATSELTICIIDVNPELKEYAINMGDVVIKRHKLDFSFVSAKDTFTGCALLYIPKQFNGDMKAVTKKIKGLSILSVSNKIDFLENGGMIALTVNDNGTYQFDINLRAVRMEKLYIGTNVLNLARTVI
jgi:hypothetical protein